MISRLEPKALSNLYLIGGSAITDEDDLNESLSPLQLQTLVLSELQLTNVPHSILQMRLTLRVLKLCGNKISQIPDYLGQLSNLRILCLDHQNPKIKTVPKSFLLLKELQVSVKNMCCKNIFKLKAPAFKPHKVLSLSGNGLEEVDWVLEFKNLQELRLNCNQISRLPASLSPLVCLLSLDISYNRFQFIPPSYADVIKRLRHFEFFNVSLRPFSARDSVTSLVNHLELQKFLSTLSSNSTTSKDIVVGVVGGSNSGKKSLVAAMKDEKGICRLKYLHVFLSHRPYFSTNTYVSTKAISHRNSEL